MKKKNLVGLMLAASMLMAGCSSTPSAQETKEVEKQMESAKEEQNANASSDQSEQTVSVKEAYPKEVLEKMNDQQLYQAARTVVLYHVAYEHETFSEFAQAWTDIDLMPTVNEVLKAIED